MFAYAFYLVGIIGMPQPADGYDHYDSSYGQDGSKIVMLDNEDPLYKVYLKCVYNFIYSVLKTFTLIW